MKGVRQIAGEAVISFITSLSSTSDNCNKKRLRSAKGSETKKKWTQRQMAKCTQRKKKECQTHREKKDIHGSRMTGIQGCLKRGWRKKGAQSVAVQEIMSCGRFGKWKLLCNVNDSRPFADLPPLLFLLLSFFVYPFNGYTPSKDMWFVENLTAYIKIILKGKEVSIYGKIIVKFSELGTMQTSQRETSVKLKVHSGFVLQNSKYSFCFPEFSWAYRTFFFLVGKVARIACSWWVVECQSGE